VQTPQLGDPSGAPLFDGASALEFFHVLGADASAVHYRAIHWDKNHEPKGERAVHLPPTFQPRGARLEQLQQAGFAWKVCAAVSSNAIVVTQNNEAVGIGGGQQNRLDAARLACERAGTRAIGGVAASDAFFPFRDGLDMLATAGVHVVVEPGGSVRDEEVIAAANEHGIVLIFTGARHFRH
jgi:AICAR transformylase/IMP cyclohydrolase PurH